MREGKMSVYQIAKQQDITEQWCRELYRRFDNVPIYKIKLERCGRKPNQPSEEEINLVKVTKEKYGFGAVNIEAVLNENHIKMSHNRIHNILKELNLANNEPKKQKKRKYIRYERRNSNSLWHTDYHELWRKHIVAFEDDASRFITGYGLFPNETAENAAYVFEHAINSYGIPKQLVSDHGTHFTSLKREGCEYPEKNVFQLKLQEYKVQHILARVKHPQTNGKLERWFGTLDRLTKHFNGDIDRAIQFYNFERPHMSLNNGHLTTPYNAFLSKMRKN